MQIVASLAARWGKEETSDRDQLVGCEFPRK
jgi:hypothetical protein